MQAYVLEAFFDRVGEILTEAGEIDQADYAYFEEKGRQGGSCRLRVMAEILWIVVEFSR